MSSTSKIYSELGREDTGQVFPDQRSDKGSEVQSFLAKYIPKSDQKDTPDELKKTISFRKQKYKKGRPEVRRKKGQYLTCNEKKALGLAKLPRHAVKYANFHSIHQLWIDYITNLVNFDIANKADDGFKMKLCRADYHGSLVKVVKASTPSMIGIEGFVVVETRNTLQIVTKADKLVIIPKMGTIFAFRVKSHVVNLNGSSMIMKPSERAVKKWKSKGPFEF